MGQNVNSYNDLGDNKRVLQSSKEAQSRGFVNISRRPTHGVAFTNLMERVAAVDPEMRVRFTSPHPKDFPDSLLALIRDTPNLCKSVRLTFSLLSVELPLVRSSTLVSAEMHCGVAWGLGFGALGLLLDSYPRSKRQYHSARTYAPRLLTQLISGAGISILRLCLRLRLRCYALSLCFSFDW